MVVSQACCTRGIFACYLQHTFRTALRWGWTVAVLLAFFTTHHAAWAGGPQCTIKIVDRQNGWPVPLVELRTTHNVRLVSDNAGVIAFDLPELMDVETWFTVTGHGYTVPADGFGYRGVRLTPKNGATLTIKVDRQLPAKRLGRITGGGIFGESQKVGLAQDWREQGILGCDSVQNAIHNGRLFWAWGDTNVPQYPLGLFHTTGATTPVQPLQSFKPPVRLRYDYFKDEKDRPRSIARMEGSGPTWISGCVSLPDREGKNRLVATYVKIRPPLTVYQTGLCVWDESEKAFKNHKVLWNRDKQRPDERPPLFPEGHAVFTTGDDGGRKVLFGDPFPRLQCDATFEAWSDPQNWQPLKPQKQVHTKTGDQKITPHRGSIAWNAFKQKWVAVFTQFGGKPSSLGEIWYAEAPSPTGPWASAIKVVTHQNYTFYNPHLHPELVKEGSPILLFEGTYTRQFAGTPPATPRHDYNQVLYRIDLNEPVFQSNPGR